MRETKNQSLYRGYAVPKAKDGSGAHYGWVINDGSFGYFTGTEEGVLAQWKRAVDAFVMREAAEDGDYISGASILLEDTYGCPRCGSLVFEPVVHSEWHQRADRV